MQSHKTLACLLALALLALLSGGCTSIRKNYPKIPSYSLPEPAEKSATRRIATQLARHPCGYSGFRLLALSSEALTARIALIDQATCSIDVQYYIFHDDPTGRLVAQRLLDAADRGVRVRILLDDNHIAGNDRDLLALDAHPNIQVRLFNPFKTRLKYFPFSTVSLATQWLLDGRRLNRRMHNKSFIVDSHVAIIGGRNIGDEYFDARQDVNFRDLDVLTVGPIVTQITSSFDTFWNDLASYPLEAFYRRSSNSPEALDELRVTLKKDARPFPPAANTRVLFTSKFAIEDQHEDDDNDPTSPAPRFHWCWGDANLIADTPDKVDPDEAPKRGPHLTEKLTDIIGSAKTNYTLISPYFVPRDEGVELISGLTKRGVTVRILTNSLASTDVALVHAGYSRYRTQLLASDVELYELGGIPSQKRKSFFRGRRTNISLHAKAFVIDSHTTFIGSMNIDPRSELLNTEMGVLVDSPELARAVIAFFDEATEPDTSYRPQLTPPDANGNRKIIWTGENDGKPVIYKNEPKAGFWRRFSTTMLSILPIEGLL